MTKSELNISFKSNLWWADSLKMIRKDKKFTLDKVESMTGIAPPYLSQLENGKHDIKLSTFEKIIESYGYEVTVTLKDDSNKCG